MCPRPILKVNESDSQTQNYNKKNPQHARLHAFKAFSHGATLYLVLWSYDKPVTMWLHAVEVPTANTSTEINKDHIKWLTKIAWHNSLLICSPGWSSFCDTGVQRIRRHQHRSSDAAEAKSHFRKCGSSIHTRASCCFTSQILIHCFLL